MILSASPRALPAASWLLFAGLAFANWLPTFRWMLDRWTEDESYTSHGPLIPLVSAMLLWLDRERLRAAAGEGSPWGLALLLPALLLHLVAGLADVSSLSGLFLIPAILGFAALLHGTAFLRAAWFPLCFLVFMVPPPEFVISTLNFSLKLLAADTAEWLLNLTGVAAVRQGSFMLFGDEKLAIGDVCSGLRSLLSLVALAVLFAWMVRDRGRLHPWAVLIAALPAAIVGNGVRICLVSYLVLWFGKDAVFTPIVGDWDLHLFTGSIIFIAAMGCLVAVTALCDRLPGARRPQETAPSARGAEPRLPEGGA